MVQVFIESRVYQQTLAEEERRRKAVNLRA
jgi:hypothetical protein